MYFAMNRFKVVAGSEHEFEAVWKNRDSRLHENPGFIHFRLLRGKTNEAEGYTPYISHSMWESEEHFIAWTKSESFRHAHKSAGQHKALYKGPPVFEGYTSVIGD